MVWKGFPAFPVSDSVRPHRRQPTRLPLPWDSPGKNAGVGFQFLLQYMKVKSENEVAQSCLTLCHPMDCSLPGSSIHGIFQARVLEWVAIAFSIRKLIILKLTYQYINHKYLINNIELANFSTASTSSDNTGYDVSGQKSPYDSVTNTIQSSTQTSTSQADTSEEK